VPQNLAEAADWFDHAAKQGLAPAQFRLGGFYAKGFGVKKDLDAARRLYSAAAAAGNAKAMHNLAVLYAEGIDGKPDYQNAAKWFRKAADYGLSDSQYNLGISMTRDRHGAEPPRAYKWFTLAARDGDRDSASKRDDVGGRMDAEVARCGQARGAGLDSPRAARGGHAGTGPSRRLGQCGGTSTGANPKPGTCQAAQSAPQIRPCEPACRALKHASVPRQSRALSRAVSEGPASAPEQVPARIGSSSLQTEDQTPLS